MHKNTCAPHNSEHAAGKHEVLNLRIKLYVTQSTAIHVESNSNIRETVKKLPSIISKNTQVTKNTLYFDKWMAKWRKESRLDSYPVFLIVSDAINTRRMN